MTQPLDEGLFLDVDGARHWVTVRGRDRANPALLMLFGPGSGFARTAPFWAPWEAHFTLVQWDQPLAGFTAAANPADDRPLTFARLAADGVSVAEAVKARFGLDKLVLLAASAGTIPGLKMAKGRPDLFAAYVGSGQVVNRAMQEQLSYMTVLDRARRAGDAAAVAELEAIGPPPYADPTGDLVKSKHANAPTPAEAAEMAALAAIGPPPPAARWVPVGVAPPEDPRAAAFAAFRATRDELAAFDAYALGLDYALPMTFIQGEADAHTVTPLVAEFMRRLRAPQVSLSRIRDAGHLAIFLRGPMLERLRTLLPALAR